MPLDSQNFISLSWEVKNSRYLAAAAFCASVDFVVMAYPSAPSMVPEYSPGSLKEPSFPFNSGLLA